MVTLPAIQINLEELYYKHQNIFNKSNTNITIVNLLNNNRESRVRTLDRKKTQ